MRNVPLVFVALFAFVLGYLSWKVGGAL